jgi:hypothetical protein
MYGVLLPFVRAHNDCAAALLDAGSQARSVTRRVPVSAAPLPVSLSLCLALSLSLSSGRQTVRARSVCLPLVSSVSPCLSLPLARSLSALVKRSEAPGGRGGIARRTRWRRCGSGTTAWWRRGATAPTSSELLVRVAAAVRSAYKVHTVF